MLESILPFLVIVLITVVGNWLEKKKKQAAQQQQNAGPETVQRRQQLDEEEEDFDEEELEPETPVLRRDVPTEHDRAPKSIPTPSQHHAPTPVAPNPLQELLKKMAEAQEAARRIAQPSPPPPVEQAHQHIEPAKPRATAKIQPIAEAVLATASVKLDLSPVALRQAMLWKIALDDPRFKSAWTPR